jgi:uncharacterized sulfatase
MRSALPLLALALACSQQPPNIVPIVADDHGYPYTDFTGSDLVQTPSLDALASQGTVFTRAFTTASSCRPAQRTLLTGLYPQQWLATVYARPRPQGHRGFREVRGFTTLPGLLAAHGYATFQGGKLWEGETFQDAGFTAGTKEPVPERPNRRELTGGRGLELGRETMEPLWSFLEAHSAGPFFVWFAPSLPHSPFDAKPRYQELYAQAPISAGARDYFSNVTRFDAVVGELMQHLDAAGLSENTAVFYLSDNGWEQDLDREGADGGERGKHSIHELGFRTPLIVRWPDHVPAGERRYDLVSSVDLFPTILGLAEIPVPAGRLGVSLLPTLLEGRASPRSRVVAGVNHLRGPPPPPGFGREIAVKAHFVRTPEWRYVSYDTVGREELYRAADSGADAADRAAEEPEVLAELRAEFERWKQAVELPLEDESPSPPPHSGG